MIFWFAKKLHLLCFLIGLLCVLPLIFLTPPFQVPDEPQHFYRAYQLSELHIFPSVENGKVGALLPSSLIQLSSNYLNTRALHTSRPIVKRTWSLVSEKLDVPLNRNTREFIDFSGAAFYSPAPYFPQSLAIATGRYFGASALSLLYLGRLANALIAVLLLSFSVWCTPRAKLAFMVAGLLPMSAYLYSSLSPDAMVIVCAYLFTALSLRAVEDERWSLPNLFIAIVCATVFCSIKVVYAPLLLVSLPIVFIGRRWWKLLSCQIAVILIPLAITGGWLHVISDRIISIKAGTSVALQAQYVMSHPFRFIQAVAHAFLWNDFFFFDTIGVLGWLSIRLPVISYALAVVAFGIALMSHDDARPGKHNLILLWWLILAGCCSGLLMLALYLYWSTIGGNVVEGVQGRYFIPIIPLVAAAIAGAVSAINGTRFRPKASALIAAIIVIGASVTFVTLSLTFWIM